MKLIKKDTIQSYGNDILIENIVEATKKIEVNKNIDETEKAPLINRAFERYYIGYIIDEEKKVYHHEVDEEAYIYAYDYLKKRYDKVKKLEKESLKDVPF